MGHTQCLLVEKGHFGAMTNRQRSTKIVGGDTMNGTFECIRPDFVFRSILFCSLSSLKHRRHETRPYRIATTDVDSEYGSTGESTNHCHRKRGIP